MQKAGLAGKVPLAVISVVTVALVQFYLMALYNDGMFSGSYEKQYLLNYKERSTYKWEEMQNGNLATVTPNFAMKRGGESKVAPLPVRLKMAFFNGNFPTSFSIWTMGSLLTFSGLSMMGRRGMIRGLGAFLRRPFILFQWILRSRGRDFGPLLIGAGLAMLGINFSGMAIEACRITSISGLFLATSGIGMRLSGVWYRLLPTAMKGLRSRSKFSLRSARLLTAGLPLGALLSWMTWPDRARSSFQGVLPEGGMPQMALVLIVAGLVIYFYRRIGNLMGRHFAMIFWILPWIRIIGWLALFFGCCGYELLADDGGLPEFANPLKPDEANGGLGGFGGLFREPTSDGTEGAVVDFGGWIETEGATETAIHAGAGAAGAAAGPLFGGDANEADTLPDEAQQKNQITSVEVSVSEGRFE